MILQYLNIFYFFIFSSLLSILIFFLSLLFIQKNQNNEKLSAYECGFDPYGDARKLFDIRFYLIAILFIIFDLETAYFFPWILTIQIHFSIGFWTMVEFLIELIIGFFYIWYIGALEWV